MSGAASVRICLLIHNCDFCTCQLRHQWHFATLSLRTEANQVVRVKYKWQNSQCDPKVWSEHTLTITVLYREQACWQRKRAVLRLCRHKHWRLKCSHLDLLQKEEYTITAAEANKTFLCFKSPFPLNNAVQCSEVKHNPQAPIYELDHKKRCFWEVYFYFLFRKIGNLTWKYLFLIWEKSTTRGRNKNHLAQDDCMLHLFQLHFSPNLHALDAIRW